MSLVKQPLLVVKILLQDVKNIKGQSWQISFDNRRASSSKYTTNIVIHNTSTKQIINTYILKQPKKFFDFVEKIHQEQMVWTFEHFLSLSGIDLK